MKIISKELDPNIVTEEIFIVDWRVSNWRLLQTNVIGLARYSIFISASEILNNVTPMWSRYRGLSTRNDNTIIQCPPNTTGIKFMVDQFDPGTLITINLICI